MFALPFILIVAHYVVTVDWRVPLLVACVFAGLAVWFAMAAHLVHSGGEREKGDTYRDLVFRVPLDQVRLGAGPEAETRTRVSESEKEVQETGFKTH